MDVLTDELGVPDGKPPIEKGAASGAVMAHESAAAAKGDGVGLESTVVDTGAGVADQPTAVDVGRKLAKDKAWDKPGRGPGE